MASLLSDSNQTFRKIDAALTEYYIRQNVPNYCDEDGGGLFLNYIVEQELNDDTLPICDELGDRCDPYNCTYVRAWMDYGHLFPIPPNVELTEHEYEALIFYVIQYCYKYGQPPSDQCIGQVIIPKTQGSVVRSEHNAHVNETAEGEQIRPWEFSCGVDIADKKDGEWTVSVPNDEENIDPYQREYFHNLQGLIGTITDKLSHKTAILTKVFLLVSACSKTHNKSDVKCICSLIMKVLVPHNNCQLCDGLCGV